MAGPIRQPAAAGQFYAGGAQALLAQIEECYLSELGPGQLPQVNPQGPRQILGLVSPHAGYPYSGPAAAVGFSHLAADGQPDTVVIIGPSHEWLRIGLAVQSSGAWRTPLGEAAIDSDIAGALIAALPELADDVQAFAYEHSLEVQVPFLQHLYGEALRIVPVMMVRQDLPTAQRVGEATAQVLAGRNAVIIASTDMTHREPPEVARRQDLLLAEFIENLDAEGLIRERERRHITMCGFGPTAAMIIAARALGATRCEILAYYHSGEISYMSDVVGYLSAKVVR